jgi:hypothetical protein
MYSLMTLGMALQIARPFLTLIPSFRLDVFPEPQRIHPRTQGVNSGVRAEAVILTAAHYYTLKAVRGYVYTFST